jgi:hypothetical protein
LRSGSGLTYEANPWALAAAIVAAEVDAFRRSIHRVSETWAMSSRAAARVTLRKAADADRRTMADFTLIALEHAVEAFEAAAAAKKAEKSTR